MEFIETRRFSDVLYDYLNENSYQELQISLIERPDQGDIIPGGGGIRKLHFAAQGKGKKGVVRFIFKHFAFETLPPALNGKTSFAYAYGARTASLRYAFPSIFILKTLYWVTKAGQIYMIALYPKGRKDNLTDAEVAEFRDLAKEIRHG